MIQIVLLLCFLLHAVYLAGASGKTPQGSLQTDSKIAEYSVKVLIPETRADDLHNITEVLKSEFAADKLSTKVSKYYGGDILVVSIVKGPEKTLSEYTQLVRRVYVDKIVLITENDHGDLVTFMPGSNTKPEDMTALLKEYGFTKLADLKSRDMYMIAKMTEIGADADEIKAMRERLVILTLADYTKSLNGEKISKSLSDNKTHVIVIHKEIGDDQKAKDVSIQVSAPFPEKSDNGSDPLKDLLEKIKDAIIVRPIVDSSAATDLATTQAPDTEAHDKEPHTNSSPITLIHFAFQALPEQGVKRQRIRSFEYDVETQEMRELRDWLTLSIIASVVLLFVILIAVIIVVCLRPKKTSAAANHQTFTSAVDNV